MGKAAYPIILLLFVTCYWATSPDYIGDTTRYAGDVIGHAQGREAQFWEFGHLLWRPWAYAGHLLAGPRHTRQFGDTPTQAVSRFLIHTNFICSAGALMLLLFLLRKITTAGIAAAVVFAMSCAASFLNYSHSGAPYIPALLFSTLALCLLATAAEYRGGGRRYAAAAGLSFATACALWFPYSITGFGMLLVPYLWPSRESAPLKTDRPFRHDLAGTFLLSLAGTAFLLFAGGAAAKGIRDANQLVRWILESDNGWSQSLTAMRAVTGVPRFTWNFGGDTVLLKRWLFSDPYNPAHIWTVAFSLGWKLAVFYAGTGAALWALWKERRAILLIIAAAGVPLLLFAVAVFEPSSAERFLPVFPFACAAFAAALDRRGGRPVACACIVALLGSSAIFNLAKHARKSSDGRMMETRRRVQALNSNVKPGALVFLLTFNDDLGRLPAVNPLDDSLVTSRFHMTDMVELASRRIPRWRTEFVERTQAQWASGREVWVSERLLAARPEAGWLWVEGDDRRIRWSELPETLGGFEYDAKIPAGSDGFVRLAQSRGNRERMARIAAGTAAADH